MAGSKESSIWYSIDAKIKIPCANTMVFVLVSQCPYGEFMSVLQLLHVQLSKTLNFLPTHTLGGRLR